VESKKKAVKNNKRHCSEDEDPYSDSDSRSTSRPEKRRRTDLYPTDEPPPNNQKEDYYTPTSPNFIYIEQDPNQSHTPVHQASAIQEEVFEAVSPPIPDSTLSAIKLISTDSNTEKLPEGPKHQNSHESSDKESPGYRDSFSDTYKDYEEDSRGDTRRYPDSDSEKEDQVTQKSQDSDREAELRQRLLRSLLEKRIKNNT